MLPSNLAQLIGLFVECIFYGIYLATFAACIQTMVWSGPELRWRSRFRNHWSMMTVVLLLFACSSLNLALGLLRILQAAKRPTGISSTEELGQDWVNIVKPLTVNIQTLIADGILVYRCWVVYGRSRKTVAFPALLWLESAACTIVGIYKQTNIHSGSRSSASSVMPIIVIFWTSTICLNIYATSMIVFRVLTVESQCAGFEGLPPLYPFTSRRRSRLQLVTRSIIESGLMYTAISIIVFITFLTKSNAVYITTAAYIQIIGITFNLILIRVARCGDEVTGKHENTLTGTNFVCGISSPGGMEFPENSSRGTTSTESVEDFREVEKRV
ncbi:hypothetical protein BDZ94DRAFT_1247816 [Collybia nuda]|uniref:Uncharacterized protein n=1 Tax=Collybia nuda TaxID=64659 RepID=A0A9P5YFR1_9AGAR|nr:hypothetical protein BDZ94DRAFT_1247816 [Collybia nuda]